MLGIPTCWYLKTRADPQFTQRDPLYTQRDHLSTCCDPNATRRNIGRVGSSRIGACVGHVDFMLFVSISFALGSKRKRNFRWNMGLTKHTHPPKRKQKGGGGGGLIYFLTFRIYSFTKRLRFWRVKYYFLILKPTHFYIQNKKYTCVQVSSSARVYAVGRSCTYRKRFFQSNKKKKEKKKRKCCRLDGIFLA